MTWPVSDVAFSASVKAAQQRLGSRDKLAQRERDGGDRAAMTDDLRAFLGRRDSFYFATASADGRPYIQHRGGPPGFLKVLDEKRLGFADFAGNRQYITVGNLAENDRAQIFAMDYAQRQRVKLWGRARIVEDDPELIAGLSDLDYAGRPERAIVFAIEAWDVNCPSHIRPRYGEAEIAPAIARLQNRIAELEAEVARLRATAG